MISATDTKVGLYAPSKARRTHPYSLLLIHSNNFCDFSACCTKPGKIN